MRHTEIFQSAMLLALTALGVSAATTQTDFSFAAGVDSTGWAQAQSNTDGHVLIESPQYPHGLWLHLVDETGDALAGIQVEYQGRPDSLVAIRCVDPAGSVRETLIWTRPEGDPLHLTLKPEETSDDLPAGLAAIDWQIDPIAEVLLVPELETRLEGWEAAAVFLRERWQDQTGRVAVQLDASTSFAVELDRPEAVEMLVDRLKQMYLSKGAPLGESAAVDVQVFGGGFALQEGVILYLPLFADANLESAVREALGRPQGRLTLEDVPSLTQLYADQKNIYSLAGLDYFTALKTLYLYNNQIADVGPLAGLTNLDWLSLERNQIADMTPLAGLTNLNRLWLEHNQIADMTPLAGLTNLNWLHLEGNQIADMTPLAGLTSLRELSLKHNQIADMTPLAGLTSLRELSLKHNQIADMTPLAGLTNLLFLRLQGNQIADMTPLAGLTNLLFLHLGNNRITDMTLLAGLTSLNWLYLGDNQIADMTPLAGLTNLQDLYLEDNQITDVGPLAGLTNLWRLNLARNQIEDLTPLVANPGLSEGDRVYLTGNPLSDQALNEQIPALQARGVRIYY